MKRLSARRLLLADHETGEASKVIRSFDKLKPTDKVFLVERVSGRERKRNLKDQDTNLRKVVASAGATVVGKPCQVVVSGFDPFWLRQAAREAREAGATVMLAETTDRFIRNTLFHSVLRPEWQASDAQLAELVECAGGMRLMTHLDPDASPREVRRYQRKRGQRYKKRKGGRPKNRTPGYKKRRKDDKERLVIWLHRHGWSIRRIAAKPMVGVPKSTVWEWIQKAD